MTNLPKVSHVEDAVKAANITLTAASVGGISLTLQRDALNIIISKIVNWLSAVIAQSGRQFDESGDCFFVAGVV